MAQNITDTCFVDWNERETVAEAMIPMIGRLYRKNNVVTSVYGRAIINQSVIGLLKSHRFVRQVEDNELSVHDTYKVLQILDELALGHAHIDIGKLAVNYWREYKDASQIEAYMSSELSAAITQEDTEEARDVVLYGFGRIGRLLARLLIERTGVSNKLRLRAIVLRGGRKGDLEKRASLLRRDSVHGPFNGSVEVDEENNAITSPSTSNGTLVLCGSASI